MEAFVYFLVEGPLVKIGWASSIFSRAKAVTPNVEWERSFGLAFDNPADALNCERAFHRLLRRRFGKPQPGREGGTEFFAVEALTVIQANLHLGEYLGWTHDLSAQQLLAESSRKQLPALRAPARTPQEIRDLAQERREARKLETDSSNLGSLETTRDWLEWLATSHVGISSHSEESIHVWWCESSPEVAKARHQFWPVYRDTNFSFANIVTGNHVRREAGNEGDVYVGRTVVAFPIVKKQADLVDSDEDENDVKTLAEDYFASELAQIRSLPRLPAETSVSDVLSLWNEGLSQPRPDSRPRP